MKAKDLLIAYGKMPLDLELRSFILFLADNLPKARTSTGARLCDASDFAAFLHELANAGGSTPQQSLVPAQARWDTCHDCGHVHHDEKECGELLGAGRTCRCETKVPA